MSADYLFVWHRRSRSFPLRFEVQTTPGSTTCDHVQAVVRESGADELLASLRQLLPEPDYIVERMWATSWETVAENFPGITYDR